MSTIAVLKGGSSLERSVSLKSGGRVEDALRRLGHEPVGIDVGPDLVARLDGLEPDAAFIALHGKDGEDGTVQQLLEILRVPYTGSGVAACVHASNKQLAKHAFRDHGIPTPDWVSFRESAFQGLGAAGALPKVADRLQFPLVVKPASQGSALGIKFAQTPEQLPAALLSAFSYSYTVLLEQHVAGRELAVSILTGPDGSPVALPIVEALPEAEDFYDFEARYEIGRTRFVCPAELDDEATEEIQTIALRAFEVLGCDGFARVDLMLDRASSTPYVLEVNPIPGLTETSLTPQAADAAGIDFDTLIGRIIDRALTPVAAHGHR